MKDYNGSNYGACEPVLVELKNCRLWMLVRTQKGRLYESFSADRGATRSAAQPSAFHSSNSPAEFVRLSDGGIVAIWNNCEIPPRVNGQGAYGGRDVLDAAVSRDEGITWLGYREVFKDPHRHESPPRQGDRGNAYFSAIPTGDGKLLVISGQVHSRRLTSLIDPTGLSRNITARISPTA